MLDGYMGRKCLVRLEHTEVIKSLQAFTSRVKMFDTSCIIGFYSLLPHSA